MTKYYAAYNALPEKRAAKLIASAKESSKYRGHPAPDLTVEDILPAMLAGVCQVSGVTLDFTVAKGKGALPFSPSLDRPDNTRPYTRDNFRIVCWAVNTGCSTWGLRVYLQIAAAALGVQPPP